MNDGEVEVAKKIEPALKLKFLSHGTLESIDLDQTRRFYEEFLGLEVVKVSNSQPKQNSGTTHFNKSSTG